MKTGIIIPCYNEENRLNSNAFIQFITKNEDYHLCFVNDGSIDSTIHVLRKLRSDCPLNISIVNLSKNAGKAAAVRAGVQFLYGMETIANIGFMDADLSTDFNDFKDLVKTLKRDQKVMVFGSRNSLGSGTIERNFLRSFFSKFIKQFILLILGLPIRDTQCGAKVFVKSIIPIVYNTPFKSKWLFDVEVFLRLKKHFGSSNIMKQIFEQPLMRWVHVDDSKLGMRDAMEIPIRLAHIWINYNLITPTNAVDTFNTPVFQLNPFTQEYRVAA